MKSVFVGFLALAAGSLIILGVNSQAQAQAAVPRQPKVQGPPSWEYKVVNANDQSGDSLQSQLDPIGKEGWELAASPKTGKAQVLVFKRPIRQDGSCDLK
jgi:hypothetical protein